MKLTLKIYHISQSDKARLNNAISRKVATIIADNMKMQAISSLSTRTGTMYADNLSVGPTQSAETPIYLKGWLPLAIERGIKRYDMKPGFLNSPKAKTSAKGVKYLVVPIQKGSLADIVILRTVTDRSKKRSWIHPGLKARDFAHKAIDHVRSMYPESQFIARRSEHRGVEDFL